MPTDSPSPVPPEVPEGSLADLPLPAAGADDRRRGPAWLRAVHHSSFRWAWLTAACTYFGYWFIAIPLQWRVAQESDADPVAVSVLFFSVLIPLTLLSIPAGVLADRFDRRRVTGAALAGSVAVSAVATATFEWSSPSIGTLVLIGLAVGTFHAVASPSAAALVGGSVPLEDLPSAVPLQTMAANLGRLLGPMLAGAAITTAGLGFSAALYGLFGLIGVVAASRLPRQTWQAGEQGSRSGAQSGTLRAGIAHARARPPAVTALVLVAGCTMLGSSYLGIYPVLAENTGHGEGGFVLLTAAGGLGSLLGVLAIGIRGGSAPRVRSASVMLATLGLFVATLGLTRSLAIQLTLVAAAGALQFGIFTVCGRVLQQVVDDAFRGRIMSFYFFAWGGLLPIGALILGLTAAQVGTGWALAASGIAATVIGGTVTTRSGLVARQGHVS